GAGAPRRAARGARVDVRVSGAGEVHAGVRHQALRTRGGGPMTVTTTTGHGAVTREDITDVINGQSATAPVSPADHGMLDTARDMVSYVHATHELRRDANGQP